MADIVPVTERTPVAPERSSTASRTACIDPLRLEHLGDDDPADRAEPYGTDEPWAPLWERFTGRLRPGYQFHAIAWEGLAAFESDDPEEAPVTDAAELYAAGDVRGARSIVMDVLGDDIRCIDAHVHLGNWEFDRDPERALQHYEVAAGIGSLSLVGCQTITSCPGPSSTTDRISARCTALGSPTGDWADSRRQSCCSSGALR